MINRRDVLFFFFLQVPFLLFNTLSKYSFRGINLLLNAQSGCALDVVDSFSLAFSHADATIGARKIATLCCVNLD